MDHHLTKEIDSIINQAVQELKVKEIYIKPLYGDIKNHLGDINPYSVTDLTNLKPQSGRKEITELCDNAKLLKAKTVCVNSINASLALHLLKGSDVKVIAVEGFPFGATSLDSLIDAVNNNFEFGVSEVDVVFPHAFMGEKDYLSVLYYLKRLKRDVRGAIKVILETSYYNPVQIATMSLMCLDSGVDFVKTSTGLFDGATSFNVALIRRCVGNTIGVKASGGIRTLEDAMRMIEHGATRIGASSLKDGSGY